MSVSVCMAAYNGEKYIIRQIESILIQLSDKDELIIVDDHSSDSTVERVEEINDPRIHIYVNNSNKGDVYSFNRSLGFARNDYIFLADQDDIWLVDKITTLKKSLITHDALLATSNFDWIDSNDGPIEVTYDGVKSEDSDKYMKNIFDIFLGKTNYFGCAMALRKELLTIVTPIPAYVESHDLWIALVSNLLRRNQHLDEATFLKRKHASNATATVSSRPFYKKFWSRVIFIISIVTIYKRIIQNRRL